MSIRRSISLFTLGLLLSSSVYAQSTAKPEGAAAAEERGEARKKLEQKAYGLLEEIIAEAPTLKQAENRVTIQAAAADLLWRHDEKRARAVFKAAIASLAEIRGAMDQSDPQYDSLVETLGQLRMSLLDTITRHDPQLALDLLRATRQGPPLRRSLSYSPPDIEVQLEGRLAGLIAARDPQRALQIARESLTKGLSYELISALSQLRTKDKEAAAALSQEIIAKLKAESRMTPDVSGIAFNLLYMFRPPEGDERPFRDLLDFLVGAALNASLSNRVNPQEQYLARNLLEQLQPMMPEIEKYAPSRVAALRRKLAELDRMTDPYTRSLNEMNKLAEQGTVDEVLAAAAKLPPESRGQGYQQVIRKAAGQGEYDRARQIANSEALAPIERKEILEEIDRQALLQAINRGEPNEARQILTKLRSAEERVSALLQLAGAATGKDDPETARQLLAEAFQTVSGRAASYQRLQAQLRVAQAYAPLDPDRSFEIITPIIDQVNDLMAAAVMLDGFENKYLKDGEWMPTGGGALSNMVVTCDQYIAALAHIDFDRARSLADRWQRSEVQLRARLLIAQTVLSEAGLIAEMSQKPQSLIHR